MYHTKVSLHKNFQIYGIVGIPGNEINDSSLTGNVSQLVRDPARSPCTPQFLEAWHKLKEY